MFGIVGLCCRCMLVIYSAKLTIGSEMRVFGFKLGGTSQVVLQPGRIALGCRRRALPVNDVQTERWLSLSSSIYIQSARRACPGTSAHRTIISAIIETSLYYRMKRASENAEVARILNLYEQRLETLDASLGCDRTSNEREDSRARLT
jgi:hypothetical protein